MNQNIQNCLYTIPFAYDHAIVPKTEELQHILHSAFGKSLCTYRSLSAQRLSEHTVHITCNMYRMQIQNFYL